MNVWLVASLCVGLALVAGIVAITGFFLVKMLTKVGGVLPFTTMFGFGRRRGIYTTLVMATGLTFGTISALFGLTHRYIGQSRYTMLVTVVIISAVPTLIAEWYFRPEGRQKPRVSTAPLPVPAAQHIRSEA